jgi:hypothetical protein
MIVATIGMPSYQLNPMRLNHGIFRRVRNRAQPVEFAFGTFLRSHLQAPASTREAIAKFNEKRPALLRTNRLPITLTDFPKTTRTSIN